MNAATGLTHDPPNNAQGEGLMIGPAARHQRAISRLWLHFWEVLYFCTTRETRVFHL